jgi:hypothetical protein
VRHPAGTVAATVARPRCLAKPGFCDQRSPPGFGGRYSSADYSLTMSDLLSNI